MRVAADTRLLEVDPGETPQVVVDVVNTSSVIDGLSARVLGIPGRCVTTEPALLPLFPDASGQLRVAVAVPRSHPAGRHPLTVEVVSTAGAQPPQSVDLDLDVRPVPSVSAAAEPRAVRSRRSARFLVEVRNDGNVALDVELTAVDADRSTRVSIDPARMRLEPGSTGRVLLRLRGPRMYLGGEVDRQVMLEISGRAVQLLLDPVAKPEVLAARTVVVTLKQHALISRGLLTVLILMSIVALWAGAFLLGLGKVFAGDPLTKTAPASFFAATAGDAGSGPSGAPAGALPKDGTVPAGTGGEVDGTVLAGDDGQPVGRILVRAWRRTANGLVPVSSAATQADGTYSVAGLFPIPYYYTMQVSSFGYATQTYGAPTGATPPVKIGAGSTPAIATLTQTPVMFRVGVNTASGALLACPATNAHCATVTLHRIDTTQPDLTSSAQDGGHYYDFANIDPATYLITVRGPGLQTTSTQYTVPLGGAGQPFRMAVSAVPPAAPKTVGPAAGSSPATVSLAVTTSAGGDDVAAAAVQLTSASNPGTVLTPNPGIAAARNDGRPGAVDSWTFTAVPAGNWQLSVTLPLTHFGTLAATGGPSITCQPGSATTPVRCAAAITVGTGNASVAARLDEFLARLRVASTPLATDQNPNPPATVALAVTDGARTVFSNDTFAVDGGTPTATFWGAAGSTYAATVSGVPPGWQAGSQSYTASNPHQDLVLTEVASGSGVGSGSSHTFGSRPAPGATPSGVPPAVPPAVPAKPSPGAS